MNQTDIYASRGGQPAAIRPRQDPVVHASQRDGGPLSRELVERYERDGYLVLPELFSAAEIESIRREVFRLRNTEALTGGEAVIAEPGSREVRSVFRVHASNPVFARLAADERLAGLARFLLADEVYIHQSRVNYKPGFRGKEFYWHSDFETWHTEDGMPRMRALSMSIALTENTPHNGPLLVVPGSHRRYVVCAGETPAEHYRASLRRQEYGVPSDSCLQELVDAGGIVACTGGPGSVTLFDCNLMHGSNGNITPAPRANVFLVYNAISNRLRAPFCNQPPRPEYIASRAQVQVLTPVTAQPQEVG